MGQDGDWASREGPRTADGEHARICFFIVGGPRELDGCTRGGGRWQLAGVWTVREPAARIPESRIVWGGMPAWCAITLYDGQQLVGSFSLGLAVGRTKTRGSNSGVLGQHGILIYDGSMTTQNKPSHQKKPGAKCEASVCGFPLLHSLPRSSCMREPFFWALPIPRQLNDANWGMRDLTGLIARWSRSEPSCASRCMRRFDSGAGLITPSRRSNRILQERRRFRI